MNNKENSTFEYTYSAKERDELRRIRDKYSAPAPESPEGKLERLRRLDRGVTAKAQAISLTFGIVGTLILGFGMSLAMSELAEILGSHKNLALPIGAVIGVLGGIIASLAHPIYNLVTNRARRKIAPEILRLTDELMK